MRYKVKYKSCYYITALALGVLLLNTENTYASARKKVQQGNNSYKKKMYEKALEKYRDAQIDSPESKPVYFNLANSMYKMGKYEEAMEEYEKSTYSKDTELQAKAYYNMGNSLYRQGKLPEAILYYKKALEINPDDEDAKYNIEYIQKKIKEMMDKQKGQQQGQQDQQQQQKQGEEEQEDKKKGKEGEEEKEEEEQQAHQFPQKQYWVQCCL